MAEVADAVVGVEDEVEVAAVEVEAAVAVDEDRTTDSLTMDALRKPSQTKTTATPTVGMNFRRTQRSNICTDLRKYAA